MKGSYLALKVYHLSKTHLIWMFNAEVMAIVMTAAKSVVALILSSWLEVHTIHCGECRMHSSCTRGTRNIIIKTTNQAFIA